MRKTTIRRAFIALSCVPFSTVTISAFEADTVLTTSLPEIEITTNRATEKTPVAFTSLGKRELGKKNDGRDIPFLLQMTPSVVSTSDAGAGVGYSGIRVRGTDGSRINVMSNGVPVNDAESHNVYWVNMPDFTSSLQDIQIQRGAGTSVNGAGAFGASINMMTASPSMTPYGEFSGTYGSYNTHKETLRAGTGLLGGHWTVDARISNIGSDGYIDRASSKLWSYLGQIGFRASTTDIRFIAFGGKEETYMAWDYASKEQMKEFGRRYNPCGEYTDSEGKTEYYPDQKDYFTQHHFQLHAGQLIGEYWKINAALFFTKGDGYYDQYKKNRTLVEYGLEPFYLEDGTKVKKSDLIRMKFNDNNFGGGNLSANYKRGGLDAVFGLSISDFKGKHFGKIKWVRNYVGKIDPLQEYYNNTGDKFDANIFARANYDITNSWSVFADLQYRTIDYKIKGVSDNYDWNTEGMYGLDIHEKYNFFNPKLGFNFTDGVHNRVYASWSVAHREPVRDNFTDGDRNHIPRAERMFDYEAGYIYSNRIFEAGANFYMMDYKDQLVLTGQLSDTGNPLSVNVPKSYRAGVEMMAALHPADWFAWNVNATLSRNRIKDFTEYIYEDEWTNPIENYIGSTPIAFSPNIILNNSFNFKYRGFEGSLMSRWVGKQYMTNAHSDEQMLNAYFVSDLSLSYNFGKIAGMKELKVGLTVYNLFNEKYENNGYAGTGYYVDGNGEKVVYRYSGYAAQAPTNVLATVTMKF